ncbi:hypothetical protein LIER_43339 [Lithospermum erythrorhizon]|uniref:Uncharacterized protein n=1 Tax=Lithospermum erythrorhizon TaxID=34254 RepID=A0AAV3PVZ7_LITER
MLGHESFSCDVKYDDEARKKGTGNKYDPWILVHGERSYKIDVGTLGTSKSSGNKHEKKGIATCYRGLNLLGMDALRVTELAMRLVMSVEGGKVTEDGGKYISRGWRMEATYTPNHKRGVGLHEINVVVEDLQDVYIKQGRVNKSVPIVFPMRGGKENIQTGEGLEQGYVNGLGEDVSANDDEYFEERVEEADPNRPRSFQ